VDNDMNILHVERNRVMILNEVFLYKY
jgi:hypothetical protein